MQIWVDADACPGVIKEILFRAAKRTAISLTLVANHAMRIPPGCGARLLQVPSGFDVADKEIVRRVAEGDLVVTADVPLAAEVIARGCRVLTPRGERLTPENIGARLGMRDFMDSLRSSGIDTGGPSAMNSANRQAFANELDRWLAARPAREEPAAGDE
ncbi:YaiI/YqxD family protein [Thiohalobacter sp.]|uniref:YaiI/YqxD family protein n=1 Tax=Thiohalobacter sp. TaxID=2025948 RepID=UPI002611FAA4|nr:YaiI/YqxD family protein [Thiohalobacter sp.]